MKKASPKLIGGFVLGAIALLVIGLITFGSGKAFETKVPFVMYFDESVGGLSIGAPITFRGVIIGEVTEVLMEYNIDTLKVRIPVYANIIPTRITRIGKERSRMDELIEKGFRAQLVSQSLVTGQLQVNLDFHPDTPIELSGVDHGLLEVPTIKSGLEALKDTLSKIDIEQLVAEATQLITDVDRIVQSDEFKASLTSLANSLAGADTLMQTLNKRTDPLLDNLDTTMTEIKTSVNGAAASLGQVDKKFVDSMKKIDGLVTNIDGEVAPLSASIQGAAGSAQSTFDHTSAALERNGPIRRDLQEILRNLALASRSVRALTAELERNPSVIIQGKQ